MCQTCKRTRKSPAFQNAFLHFWIIITKLSTRIFAWPSILWRVTDPQGLDIVLAQDSWEHTILRHREIADYLAEVRLTVRDPDAIYADPKSTQERATGAQVYWYLKSGILSGRLKDDYVAVIVKVVVEKDTQQGYVSTALPIDKPMTRLVLKWTKH